MALRLRRGTDAQRLLITPLEGELIYTTDTNEIYVGDGVTAGGVRVTGDVPANLQDLDNVSTAVPGENDVLIWDAIAQQWGPVPLDTIAPGSTLASMADVDITNPDDNQILSYNSATSSWNNTAILTTDLKGSVFADDSRIVVDGLTGFVYADHFVAYDQINFSPTDDILEMNIYSYGNRSRQNFYVTSEDPEVDLSTYTGYYATVNFGYEDSINGANVRGTIRGSDADIRIAHDVNEGFLTDESKYFTAKDGNFGFGTYTPDYKVDVRGDLRADALIGALYADDSTLVVDGFNGAVYASELTTSVINTQANDLSISNPGGITEIHIESQGNRSRQNFYVTAPDEVTDLSTYTGYYATINFGYTDTPNGSNVRGTIRGSDTDIRLAHDVNEGFLADETKYFTAKDGNFGFGTYTPEAKVDVRGPILPGRYADAAARDAAIPTPVAGMTIFVTDGDGAGNPKFQGNTDGTTGGWVDLN